MKKLFKETHQDIREYVKDLPAQEIEWMKTYARAASFGEKEQLTNLFKSAIDNMTAEQKARLAEVRSAKRKDIMDRNTQVDTDANYTLEDLAFTPMNELALIKVLGLKDRAGVSYMKNYGDGEGAAIGERVVICIEGHVYDKEWGDVVECRENGDLLVEIRSRRVPSGHGVHNSGQILPFPKMWVKATAMKLYRKEITKLKHGA